jgi:hypothetical protein
MATSGSFSKYPVSNFGLYCTWSASQSVTGNYSDVTLNVYLKYYTLSVGSRSDSTVSINGVSETYTAPAISDSVAGYDTTLLKTYTVRVAHNSNGTKTGVALSASWRFSGTYSGTSIGTITASTTIDLDALDRTAPTVSCSTSNITANGFKISATSSATADIWQYSTNGGTSWTQFSTTAGTSANTTLSSLSPNTTYSVKVRARKKSNQVYGTSSAVSTKTLGGSTIDSVSALTADASSVSISMSTTVYDAAYTHKLQIKNGSTVYLEITGLSWAKGTAARTISLTAAQRTTLLTAMASVKSFTATFALLTYSGTTQIGTTSTKTATVQTTSANSAPTMDAFTFYDGRSATSTVTGDDQVFIQGYSYLYVTPGTATARNNATISSYSATCNGVTLSNTTGAVINLGAVAKSGTLDVVVTATDSRGYTVSNTQQITVIAYAKPKVSSLTLRRTNDIEAEMQLAFNGTISAVSFSGTQKNSLLYVRYRYKLTSATSYGSYTSILSSVTKSGTSYSFSNLELCSLDANSSYDFHLQIRDQLNSLSSVDLYYVVPQGTPLVALRKKKVGINTPDPEVALHVVGDAKVSGTVTATTVTATTLNGALAPSKLSSAVTIAKGGTGATTAAAACTNLISGQTIAPKVINVTGNQYWIDGVYGINMQNSDIIGINGLYLLDAVDSQGEGINFYRSSTTWDRLYSYAGTLYYAPNVATDTHPGTRYTVYHSGGATIPLTKGGTGGTTAATARSNLGITATSLYNGTLSSGSITFNYGSYKAYVIIGRPKSSSALISITLPKAIITTSAVTYQLADESNYVTFTIKYSSTTTTLTWNSGSSTGQITRVFGIN